MLGQAEQDFVSRSQRVLNIIWAAFLSACGIYALLGNYVLAGGRTGGEALATPVPLHLILGVLAITEVFVVFIAPRFLLSEERLKAALRKGPTAPLPDTVDPADSRMVSLVVLTQNYQTAKIIVWAVAESIAIYGLILTIMLRTTTWLYPFVLVSVVLLVLIPPRLSQFLEDHRTLIH